MNINQILDSGPDAAPKQPQPQPQLQPSPRPQSQPQSQQSQPQSQPPPQHAYRHELPPQSQPQQQQQFSPSTPVQNIAPQSYHDYTGPHTHASPGRQPSHGYGPHQMPPGGPYASPPPPYLNATPYAGRGAPGPLQSHPSNEMRSPSIASVVVPSPYRQTPASSTGGAAGGYPLATGHQTPSSPVQRHHHYPSAPNAYTQRDSYFPSPVPPGAVGPPGPGAAPYGQSPSMPQTPPVAGSTGPNSYGNQRSQSTHSISTPSSAHNQNQYEAPYAAQGSPVSATQAPPHIDLARNQSQPPTPLGPPLSGPRQVAVPPTWALTQPPSPYQQRTSITSGQYHHPSQGSSVPHAPPAIQRQPTEHSGYEPHPGGARPIGSQSQSERGKSVSVSPRTRVPSLASSAGQTAPPQPDTESHRPHPKLAASSMPSAIEPDRERAVTPAKRKLDDRDMRPEELERREVRPAPFEGVNGAYGQSRTSSHGLQPSTSPAEQQKRKLRYSQPPVWASRYSGSERLKAANFVLRKVQHHHVGQANGKSGASSRQNSPEERRPAPVAQPSPAPQVLTPVDSVLGPWEPSITGRRPYEDLSKHVADFLFLHILHNENIGEITSLGIQFEIEAKLGKLISKDTNDRVSLPVATECALFDNGRVAFRSSMTEAQHKAFNGFLNSLVVETDPRNPDNAERPRVAIQYKHRREIDKFFEMPPSMRDQLPSCVQSLIPAKHTVKVRVTYDQKTKEVLAKIVKARVADINLYFPTCPLDCRISINLEMDWDGSVEELERMMAGREGQPDRSKDRLSYRHGHYQVDLTQVTQMVRGPNNTQRLEKEHELEIELNQTAVIEQGRRAAVGQPHQYQELVDGLVDNVRVLSRKARDFPH